VTIGRYDRPRNEPFFWWGAGPQQPYRRTLGELAASGRVPALGAALLAALLEHGVSLIVLSPAAGAGKSTLLAALLDAVTASRQRLYLRGSYEPFDFVESAPSSETLLLANEISPHLPIYLWGPAVARLFTLGRQGYQIAATAHAVDVPTFVHLLTTPPLNVPVEDLARPKAIALLLPDRASEQGPGLLSAVCALRPGRSPRSAAIQPVGWADSCAGGFTVDEDAAVALAREAGDSADRLVESIQRHLSQIAQQPADGGPVAPGEEPVAYA
jgi:hypothetical protein